jgi:hypothetical protein
MARKQKLNVYRTPIGFHDAYVAATSQRAALKARGSEADPCASGVAEIVTEEVLTREPFENPGFVVRRSRGTNEAYVADLAKKQPLAKRRTPLPSDEEGRRRAATELAKPPPRSARQAPETTPYPKTKAVAKPNPRPRPSRAKLDDVEQAIECAQVGHAQKIASIQEKEKRPQQERPDLNKRHEIEMAKLESPLAKARDSYTAVPQKWRE